jgi:hypothetical protein
VPLPCERPIEYSLGVFDERFGMTQAEFLAEATVAEGLWEQTLGRELFRYVPGAQFKVNLIFDTRQEQTIEGSEKKFKGYIDAIIKTPKKKGQGWNYFILDWKGQRLSAPILTPNGWTTMGALKVGDEITSSDGGVCRVKGIFPLGTRDVYRVTFRDGSFVDCTDDHLWKVSNASNTTKILTTKELIDKPQYKFLPVLSNPVRFSNKQSFPIDPYLFGILLGDGCLRSGVRFSTSDKEIVDNISTLIPETVQIKKVGKSKYDYQLSVDGKGIDPHINRNPILNSLREFGLFGKLSQEKFIPDSYLFGDVNQRLSLIQGLLDTDGWVQKGYAKFSTTSVKLADGMKHLVGSLGGVAFISTRKKKRNPTEHVEYIVTVRLPHGLSPFRLKRKLKLLNPIPYQKLQRSISKIEKIGQDEMQCISVDSPDHLYVTNDFILTHNTTSWGWKFDKKTDFKKTVQLAFYKIFWSKKNNIPLKDIKTAFVLLKRTAKKDRCELVPVSVGEKTIEKAMETLYVFLGSLKQNLTKKNRDACEYCVYHKTPHCQ